MNPTHQGFCPHHFLRVQIVFWLQVDDKFVPLQTAVHIIHNDLLTDHVFPHVIIILTADNNAIARGLEQPHGCSVQHGGNRQIPFLHRINPEVKIDTVIEGKGHGQHLQGMNEMLPQISRRRIAQQEIVRI